MAFLQNEFPSCGYHQKAAPALASPIELAYFSGETRPRGGYASQAIESLHEAGFHQPRLRAAAKEGRDLHSSQPREQAVGGSLKLGSTSLAARLLLTRGTLCQAVEL